MERTPRCLLSMPETGNLHNMTCEEGDSIVAVEDLAAALSWIFEHAGA